MTISGKSVGVFIPTLNAGESFPKCIAPLFEEHWIDQVLVIDSGSTDRTRAIAESDGARVLTIEKSTFNHGATREKARNMLGCDVVIMLTQDAYPKTSLKPLVMPIIDGAAGVAYGRQVARPGADTFERVPRQFNYPEDSHIRSIGDLPEYGVFTFFNSNSCAAYSNQALTETGGIPRADFSEDVMTAVALLRAGHKIAYVAETIVEHSHRYTLREDFMRMKQVGSAYQKIKELREASKLAPQRGRALAISMMRELISKGQWHILPYLGLHLSAKYAGYRLGERSRLGGDDLDKRT
jgi:rhamnosyltransferase